MSGDGAYLPPSLFLLPPTPPGEDRPLGSMDMKEEIVHVPYSAQHLSVLPAQEQVVR